VFATMHNTNPYLLYFTYYFTLGKLAENVSARADLTELTELKL